MVSRFTERDDVRDIARGQSASYSPTKRNQRRTNRVQDIMGKFPSLLGAAMTGAKSVVRNQAMHGQNRDYFGGNRLNDKIPENVRESLMTPDSQKFYDKYMNLANMAQDRTRKQEYLDTAETARRNAQITGRLNYGLSQIDPDNEYINSAGLPSYSQDLFGEGQPRFDMDRFKEAMGMGEGILGGLSPLDVHPDVIDNYAQKTFEGPGKSTVLPNIHTGETYYDRGEGLDFLDDPDQPYVAPDDYVEDDFGDFYQNEDTLYGPRFDDSNREQGIMDQHYQSPISPILDIDTPSDGLSGRPNMMDISGRGINRGLFPYPGYNSDFVKILQQGRGELPIPGSENQPYNFDIMNRDFDYAQSNRDRVDNYRLDQLLERMRPEEVKEEEFQMFGPRGR